MRRRRRTSRNFHQSKEEEDAINKIGRDGVYGIYAPVQKAMREEEGGLNYGQQVIFEDVFLRYKFSGCVNILIDETGQEANIIFRTTPSYCY